MADSSVSSTCGTFTGARHLNRGLLHFHSPERDERRRERFDLTGSEQPLEDPDPKLQAVDWHALVDPVEQGREVQVRRQHERREAETPDARVENDFASVPPQSR